MKKVNVYVTEVYVVEVPDEVAVSKLEGWDWDNISMVIQKTDEDYKKFHGFHANTLEITIEEA